MSLHAKVAGYVKRVLVDRGSVVREGQPLVEITAPELQARIAEAQSKVQAAESDRLQAEAQLAAAQSTYERLKKAAETPGAVAGNEIVQVEKQVEAGQALVRSRQQASRAAEAAAEAQKNLEAYLRIAAPFEGVITDRLVHPGALAGPAAGAPLLVLQQISHLRLVVPVPEEDVGGLVRLAQRLVPRSRLSGACLFRDGGADRPRSRPQDPHHAGRAGCGQPRWLARARHVSAVAWPVRRSQPSLWVPRTAVVTTTERTFVIRDRRRRGRVGGCPQRAREGRHGGSDRQPAAGRPGRPARHRRAARRQRHARPDEVKLGLRAP